MDFTAIPLFQGLTDKELERVRSQLGEQSLKTGEQVLSEAIRNVVIPWPRMIWRGESDF